MDFDGKTYDKGTISVQVERDYIFYDEFTQTIHFPAKGVYSIYNVSGQIINSTKHNKELKFFKNGLFIIYNHQSGKAVKMVIP